MFVLLSDSWRKPERSTKCSVMRDTEVRCNTAYPRTLRVWYYLALRLWYYKGILSNIWTFGRVIHYCPNNIPAQSSFTLLIPSHDISDHKSQMRQIEALETLNLSRLERLEADVLYEIYSNFAFEWLWNLIHLEPSFWCISFRPRFMSLFACWCALSQSRDSLSRTGITIPLKWNYEVHCTPVFILYTDSAADYAWNLIDWIYILNILWIW